MLRSCPATIIIYYYRSNQIIQTFKLQFCSNAVIFKIILIRVKMILSNSWVDHQNLTNIIQQKPTTFANEELSSWQEHCHWIDKTHWSKTKQLSWEQKPSLIYKWLWSVNWMMLERRGSIMDWMSWHYH